MTMNTNTFKQRKLTCFKYCQYYNNKLINDFKIFQHFYSIIVDANIKIDAILHNEEQWKILVDDSQYCMTACSDSFLILLNTMSDRYSILRQPRHK